MKSPVDIFWESVGNLPARAIQSTAKTGASTMIVTGLIDWKNSAVTGAPTTDSLVRSSANRDNVVAACSKTIQNSIAAIHIGM
jgi:hypothetical protein